MREEALTKESALLLPRFSHFPEFYLAGGTALALQIGHRISVDFDLFSDQELPANILEQIKRTFKNFSIEITYRSPEQLNVLINGIKITFLIPIRQDPRKIPYIIF